MFYFKVGVLICFNIQASEILLKKFINHKLLGFSLTEAQSSALWGSSQAFELCYALNFTFAVYYEFMACLRGFW